MFTIVNIAYKCLDTSMGFKKGNKFGVKPVGENPLHRTPLTIRVNQELFEKIMAIPDWRLRLREELPKLVEQWQREIT